MNATNDPRSDVPPPRRSRLARLAELWFGLHAPVDRVTYLVSGLALVLFKYLCDALPSVALRGDAIGPHLANELQLALALLTLPFL